jgi:putative oxidoreductase
MEPARQTVTTSIGLLILRLGAGGYMATHGWGKVQMLYAGDFDKFGDPIGLGNTLSLVLVTGAEFLCAVLVMLGLATRFAAAPVAFTMAVAAFVAHRADPWTAGRAYELFTAGATKFPVSKEPALMFLIPFLALVFTGPGEFSLDRLALARWRRRRGGTTGA